MSDLLGDEALLFKDKINFKPPGGAGFLAHQDCTAWAVTEPGMPRFHITAMVAIDHSNKEKGCLEVVPGLHKGEMAIPNVGGVIVPEVESHLTFVPLSCDPGDVVLFGSYLPHKAGPNLSHTWRRSAFLTYNGAGDGGDARSKYYTIKAATQQPLSINNDFAGTIENKLT